MMESPSKTSNPLFTIAAIAVTLFSGVGIATMMGWIPSSHSKASDSSALIAQPGTPGAASTAGVAAPGEAGKPGVAAMSPLPADTAAGAAAPESSVTNGSAGAPPHHHRKVAHLPPDAAALPPPGTLADSSPQGVPPPGVGAPADVGNAPTCAQCGTVHSVFLVETKGSGTGLGAVAGGVLGAVVGHQVGSGNGNTLATLIGAGGGALAGNTVEQNVKKTSSWKVSVDMSDGSQRTFTFHDRPAYNSGDRVRVSNGQLVSN